MKSKLQIIVSAFALLLFAGAVYGGQLADRVVVEKSESRLYLMREGQAFASFHVVFGANPEGHKRQQGDERTPEGQYLLNYKNANSLYYRLGKRFRCEDGAYQMLNDEGKGAVIIASEPLTQENDWIPVAPNCLVMVSPDTSVSIAPIEECL